MAQITYPEQARKKMFFKVFAQKDFCLHLCELKNCNNIKTAMYRILLVQADLSIYLLLYLQNTASSFGPKQEKYKAQKRSVQHGLMWGASQRLLGFIQQKISICTYTKDQFCFACIMAHHDRSNKYRA